jgi:hypothetical protein
MLSASDFNKMVGAHRTIIQTLGVPAVWKQAKPPQQTATAVVGFKSVGPNEAEIVNAYGIEAKILTIAAGDTPVAPEKFDTFEVNGETFVAQSAQAVHLNGQVIGYRCLVKGR